MEGALLPLPVRLLLFVALPAAGWLTTSAPMPPSTAPKDGIRINVTTLRDNGEVSKEQVVLNITYENGQVYVNDLPVSSGVTRMHCQTLIVKSENLKNLEEKEYFGIVTVRILVHEWPMTSGSSSQLIVIQEEVVEIDGRQVRYLESISSLQTTSHYLVGNVETTVEGNALPGKLPETPLRAEPPSSYKWMEKLRKALCRFWGSVFPVFFMFLNVMVVGVLGAAGVIAVLKVLFPVCENKGVLQVDKMNVITVAPIILYPEGSEKTAEKLQDKTFI
ncbi:hypothetical protein U0070_000440 [Myodes glareolus]|uniref:Glycoprotein integral membrane protein 1 n=1 Tax=Myodes glareolus TaxID=447135 RepID=A0AAW0IQM8_MYOGA